MHRVAWNIEVCSEGLSTYEDEKTKEQNVNAGALESILKKATGHEVADPKTVPPPENPYKEGGTNVA